MLHKNFAHHYRITIQTFLSIFFLFWPFNVLGQPEAISTDRILQTNTVDILQPGYFQIETGVYSYETDRESNLKSNHNFLNNNFFQVGKDFPPSRRRKQIQLNNLCSQLGNNFPPSRSKY